jgi:hypothetical protein
LYLQNSKVRAKDVVIELVFHGHSKCKRINERQRNKEQATIELIEHYEMFHGDLINNESEKEDNEFLMDSN